MRRFNTHLIILPEKESNSSWLKLGMQSSNYRVKQFYEDLGLCSVSAPHLQCSKVNVFPRLEEVNRFHHLCICHFICFTCLSFTCHNYSYWTHDATITTFSNVSWVNFLFRTLSRCKQERVEREEQRRSREESANSQFSSDLR